MEPHTIFVKFVNKHNEDLKCFISVQPFKTTKLYYAKFKLKYTLSKLQRLHPFTCALSHVTSTLPQGGANEATTSIIFHLGLATSSNFYLSYYLGSIAFYRTGVWGTQVEWTLAHYRNPGPCIIKSVAKLHCGKNERTLPAPSCLRSQLLDQPKFVLPCLGSFFVGIEFEVFMVSQQACKKQMRIELQGLVFTFLVTIVVHYISFVLCGGFFSLSSSVVDFGAIKLVICFSQRRLPYQNVNRVIIRVMSLWRKRAQRCQVDISKVSEARMKTTQSRRKYQELERIRREALQSLLIMRSAFAWSYCRWQPQRMPREQHTVFLKK